MKKTLIAFVFIIIFTIVLRWQLLSVVGVTVTGLTGDGWNQNYGCKSSNNIISFEFAGYLIKSPWPDDATNFLKDTTLQKYCINTDYVGSLADYHNCWNQQNIGFCPIDASKGIDDTTAIDGTVTDSTKYFASKAICGGAICCPSSAPYVFTVHNPAGGGAYLCCDSEDAPKQDPSTFAYKCADQTTPVTGISSPYADLGSNQNNPVTGKSGDAVFPDAESYFTCPGNACFMTIDLSAESSDNRILLTQTDAAKYACVASITAAQLGTLVNASGTPTATPTPSTSTGGITYLENGTAVCYGGKVILVSDLKSWGSMVNLFLQCQASQDPTDCLNCYSNCKGQNSCNYVWDAGGCVPTDTSGLITRIFQIGIGIIGAVGIFRIMQAAIMRQSGEPAKIQESYDIISSVIIGFIVLLGAILILRVIGLQILPFDFLK